MDKKVLITGANGGLGRELLKLHLENGDKVFGLDLNFSSPAKENMRKIYCDMSSEESVKKAANELKSELSSIDILYNTAGVFSEKGRVGIQYTEVEDCKKMMDINAFGTLRLCKALWEKICAGTLIVNISSEAGSIGGARRKGEYGYCMSKAALNMASKLLSNELWDKNARVICIHPGWMKTAMGGERAQRSSESITAKESAKKIYEIANEVESIPRDVMFITYKGEILPW